MLNIKGAIFTAVKVMFKQIELPVILVSNIVMETIFTNTSTAYVYFKVSVFSVIFFNILSNAFELVTKDDPSDFNG